MKLLNTNPWQHEPMTSATRCGRVRNSDATLLRKVELYANMGRFGAANGSEDGRIERTMFLLHLVRYEVDTQCCILHTNT